jgi:S1-C subfamily serine protease
MAVRITAKVFGTMAGVVVLAGTIAAAAFGIVGGSADGNSHPYVGEARLTFPDGSFELCSGALVSATRFVTAAHCFPNGSQVEVSFDESPKPWASATRVTGEVFNDPGWELGSKGVPTADTHDVAVVLLAGDGVPPPYATLPTESQVNTLPSNQLIDVVGYGVQSFDPLLYGTRRLGIVKLINGGGKVGAEYLKLSANQSQGKAAACEGDSGGPDLLHNADVMIGITSFSVDANCSGVTYSERIDRQSTIDFISEAGSN